MRKSFIAYLGGKSRLTKTIIPKIPDHKCYCEVFAGGAWLLFRKDPSETEIINDINRELTTLYRVVQNHLYEFIRYFRWALIARDEFDRIKKENPETLTDIQRSVRFYYLLRTSYCSMVKNPTFGTATTGRPRLNLTRIEEDLSEAHLRLSQVTIENLSFEKLIPRYDRPHTFFYIDPPYFGCEDDYGKGMFAREDFEKLKDLMKGMKGRFIMSINNVPEIRKLFSEFKQEEVKTTYSVSKKNSNKVTELLISNF